MRSIVLLLAVAGVLSTLGVGRASGATPSPTASGSTSIPVPAEASRYKREIAANAYRVFGLRAPVSILAAQIHQESRWRPNARSPVGAAGLTQFMPATAKDMGKRYPAECAPVDVFDPSWAIRCQHRYMLELLNAIKRNDAYPGFRHCDAWAMGLSAYNGGAGWLNRDRRRTIANGFDPNRWWGNVETHPDPKRAPQFVRENRGYPRLILKSLTPRYVAAGWGAGTTCN